jgi:NAD(P)-dependent dehydrogenase (short-subunit alcohol dehydrogenase family)
MRNGERGNPESEGREYVSKEAFIKSETFDISNKRFDLTSRVAIVTGSSRGIGKAIALGFAEFGADIVVNSRKQEHLETVSKQISDKGRKVLTVAGNLGEKDQIDKLISETLNEFGRIDILVNNHVTLPIFGPFLETTTESAWDKIMDVNLKSYYQICQSVVPQMKKQGKGSIINLATVGALNPEPGMGCYSISKAGVIMLTKILAVEHGKFGIRTNVICPGLIKTYLSQNFYNDPELYKKYIENCPMGRLGEPDEFVGVAVFLASDASSFVNGATISVDGGFNVS